MGTAGVLFALRIVSRAIGALVFFAAIALTLANEWGAGIGLGGVPSVLVFTAGGLVPPVGTLILGGIAAGLLWLAELAKRDEDKGGA